MDYDKKWYKSKAVWASAVALIVACAAAAFGEGSSVVGIIIAIASAMGIYGRVAAKSKLV